MSVASEESLFVKLGKTFGGFPPFGRFYKAQGIILGDEAKLVIFSKTAKHCNFCILLFFISLNLFYLSQF